MKKYGRILAAAGVVLALVIAWRIGYALAPHADNIPSREQVWNQGEVSAEQTLKGYPREMLLEVWGEPDFSLFGMFGDIWAVEGTGEIVVYYDTDARVCDILLD